MSTKTLVFVLPSLVIVLGLIIFIARLSGGSNTVQPINYNHKVHIEQAGLNCTDCHIYAETSASASLPTLETCQTCHNDAPLTESPEEKKVLKYVTDKLEIPWVRIYTVPDHVYFSHRRHVVRGKLECSACHGLMAELTVAVSFPARPVTMDNCLQCHKQMNASTDCLACHR